MEYSLYILYSQGGDRYYTGSSERPDRRLLFHNSKEKGFTARFRPWEIVYLKKFPTKKLARLAEKKIKSWKSKIMIERLIKGEVEL